MSEQKDHEVVRNVFGDSDEDEPAEYGGQDEIEQELHVWLLNSLLFAFYSEKENAFFDVVIFDWLKLVF